MIATPRAIVESTNNIDAIFKARRLPWRGIPIMLKNMKFARSVCARKINMYGTSLTFFISVPIMYTVNTSMNIWKNMKKNGYERNVL